MRLGISVNRLGEKFNKSLAIYDGLFSIRKNIKSTLAQ